MSKILVIPDVHGRSFWKEATEKYDQECEKIIFLGDYVDPYQDEGFTRKDAIRTLEEIIEFKLENKDKVVMLLGNHKIISFKL
jgi:predicted phosphodiesterase